MALGDITLADVSTHLLEIRKMKISSAVDLALISAISAAPAAHRDWEARLTVYLNRAIQLQERDGTSDTPTNSSGLIYTPLVYWASTQAPFVANTLAVCQQDITATVVLPTAFATLNSAIADWISSFYPNGSANYYMLATDLPAIAYGDIDSETGLNGYTPGDQTIVTVGTSSNATLRAVVAAVNDIIYYTKTHDDAIDLDKGGEFLSLLSYPIVLLYTIMNFLRNALPSGTGSGTFLSATEWSALSSAAANFLTSV